MEHESAETLSGKAKARFGETRAQELKPDLEKLAEDLEAIRGYPLTIEDEL